MDNGVVQQALIGEILGQAEWRKRKATEFPDDPRNEQAADGLAALADFVTALDAESPVLDPFRPLVDAELGLIFAGPEASAELSRFRWYDPHESFEGVLAILPAMIAEYHSELDRLAGDYDEESKA